MWPPIEFNLIRIKERKVIETFSGSIDDRINAEITKFQNECIYINEPKIFRDVSFKKVFVGNHNTTGSSSLEYVGPNI